LFAAVALTLACAETPRCKPIERCDVRHAACQQAALRQAACLRGLDESSERAIAVKLMKRDDFVQGEVEGAAEQSEASAQMRRGLTLFGFTRAGGSAEDAAEQRAKLVGAYYDADERNITILDFDRADSAFAVNALVHEMVHALQDRAGQLAPREPSRRFDQALAHAALIEGEATIAGDEAWVAGLSFAFDETKYVRALARYRDRAQTAASYDPFRFETARMRFAYAFGASYLWPLRARGGPAALADAYAVLPASTDAIMRGDPTLEPDDLGDAAVPVLSDDPDLPALSLVGSYHPGRFLYEVGLGTRQARIPPHLLPAGDRFVADTLSVFATEDDRVLAVYRVRFADEEDLHEISRYLARDPDDFEEWPEDNPPHIYAGVDGRDLWWAEAEWSLPSEGSPPELSWQTAPEADFGYGDGEDVAPALRIQCLHSEESD
jgi:hypothetical protein